jgi:hypothetical protein
MDVYDTLLIGIIAVTLQATRYKCSRDCPPPIIELRDTLFQSLFSKKFGLLSELINFKSKRFRVPLCIIRIKNARKGIKCCLIQWGTQPMVHNIRIKNICVKSLTKASRVNIALQVV